jgi:hypothetical protein
VNVRVHITCRTGDDEGDEVTSSLEAVRWLRAYPAKYDYGNKFSRWLLQFEGLNWLPSREDQTYVMNESAWIGASTFSDFRELSEGRG